MPTLLACLSTGKGTWSEINKIMQAQPWDKIFLMTNAFGKENFTPPNNAELVLVDAFQETTVLVEQIKKALKERVKDFEVALNLASGSGKEHMALLEAVLEMGLNFRLVTVNNHGQMEVLGLEK